MKKINRRRALKLGIGGLATAVAVGCCYGPKIKRRTLTQTPQEKINLIEQNKKELYELIENHLYEFNRGTKNEEGYVDFMAKYSSQVRDNIRIKGLEAIKNLTTQPANLEKQIQELGREAVVEAYVGLHKQCLDMAFSGLKETPKNIDALAENLVIFMRESATIQDEKGHSGLLDYEHPAVFEGYKAFAKNRVEFYKKILQKNLEQEPPKEDFNEVIKRTFTRQEFEQELQKYAIARKKLYDGFTKSLDNYRNKWPGAAFVVRMIGPRIVDSIRKKSDEYNSRELKKVYGEKEQSEN